MLLTGSRVLLDKRLPPKDGSVSEGSQMTGLTLGRSFQLQEQGCPGDKHKGPRFSVRRLQVEHVTLVILLTETLRIKSKTETNLLGLANRTHVDTRDREHLYVLISSSDLPPVGRTHAQCQDPLSV